MTDPSPRGGPDRAARLVAAVVAVASVLVVSAAATLALGNGHQPSAPAATTTTIDLDASHDDVAARFLADWNRWRTVEVMVEGTFARQTPDGERLESRMVLAQRPGQRVVSRLGGVEGFDDQARIRCVPESNGTTRCDRIEDGLDAETRRRRELETWADYLSGSPPYYRALMAEDGCYELVLTRAVASADFGRVARFCFDDASGALVRTRLEYRNGLVETTEAHRIETVVAPEVFDGLLEEPAGRGPSGP